MTSTMTHEDTRLVQKTSNESDSVAHIVTSFDPTLTVSAYVLKARVEGIPLVALCGHIWMPSRDATKLPVCQACKDIYESRDRFDPDGTPNSSLPDAG